MYHLNKPVAATCLAVASAFVQAQQATYDFNISAQPVGQVLEALAKQTGLQPFYAEGVVKGAQSPGVKGKLSLREALDKALAGTGLTYQFTGEKSVAIKTATAEKVAELAVIEIKEDAEKGYAVRRASTGTKTDTRLMETPVSIQVVPKTILDDKQAMSLPDAVNGNVSGVLGRSGGGFLYDNFVLRGFSDTSFFGTAYRNGLMNRQDIYDLSNVEQIEIVKGPAAVLYGRIEPGGMVNYVTKKPLDTPYHAIQQQVGSDHQFRTSIDTTGPIDENKTLLYRLNASYTDNESFRDFVGNERYFIAPSLTWRPTKNFEATVEVEYKRDSFQPDIGIPAIGNRPADIPFKRSLSDGKERQLLENTLIAFDWTYRFNDDWKITQRYQQQDWSLGHQQILARGLLADNRTMPRWAHKGSQNVTTQGMNLDLTGKFDLLGAKHELLLGLDEFRAETKSGRNFSAAPTIDIFNPIYGQLDLDTLADNGYFYRKQRWSGLYFQDQITMFERLHFLIGGRYDRAQTGQSFSAVSLDAAKAGRVGLTDKQFSPRIGVLYELRDWLSAYGSYTESFGANNGQSATGETFKPERAKQYEIGFKTETLDKRLTSTVSLFDLTRDNILTADPNNPLFQVLAGEARSKGIEADVSGQVTDKLKLLATFAHMDARYTRNNDGLQGNRLENAPRNQGSIWGTWQFNDAYKAGLGMTAVGERMGDAENSYKLPGYARFDALVAYTQRVGQNRLTAQLNIYNLFDKKYYANSGGDRASIIPGTPRSFLASVKYEF